MTLGPSLAHLLELPNKIHLSRDEYLTVQQIYRGWALLGIVIAGALLSTFTLTILERKNRKVFAMPFLALLCLTGGQVVFWIFTFPTNQQTNNWTVLPADWQTLRAQWEYSHAAGAILNLIAFMALILAASTRDT